VIRPEVADIHWADFTRIEETILRGERAAEEAMPRIREILGREAEPEAARPPAPAEEPPAGILGRLRRAAGRMGARFGVIAIAGLLGVVPIGCGRGAGKDANVPSASLLAAQEAFERVATEVVPTVVNIQAEDVDPAVAASQRAEDSGSSPDEGAVGRAAPRTRAPDRHREREATSSRTTTSSREHGRSACGSRTTTSWRRDWSGQTR
jgi:hypothetical protein